MNVLDHIDYVEYLNEWFVLKKSNNPSFSFQVFAESAGYKAKSHLAQVLSGKKQLSRKSIQRVATALALNSKEFEYFNLLVFFKTSKTAEEKSLYWSKIQKFVFTGVKTKALFKKFKFLEEWYIAPIREIIAVVDFENDYKYLGSLVIPKISAKEAKFSVDLLLELQMVIKEEGRYHQTDSSLFIQPELRTLAARNFQKSVIKLGYDALDAIQKENRNIQTITFGSNSQLNGELNLLVEKFIDDVYLTVNKHTVIEEVRQLNIQLFPMSKDHLATRKKEHV